MSAASTGGDAVGRLALAVAHGERPALARALNLLDDTRAAARSSARALLGALPAPEHRCSAHLVGFTGPPGAGKSTLISALVSRWRARGLSVGVLAVDPSSPLSGGALLGDRLRMRFAAEDHAVFIRSLASRGSYGGLAPELMPMAAVMLSAFDRVVIETVGVGQREIDVAFAADTTCLVIQPGAGDSVQFLKAGIMEVPDLLLVNKADLGPLAERTRTELLACLARDAAATVLATSAVQGCGVQALVDALEAHHHRLVDQGLLADVRRRAQAAWVVQRLREEFGRYGLGLLGAQAEIERRLLASSTPILAAAQELREQLLSALAPALDDRGPVRTVTPTLPDPLSISRP